MANLRRHRALQSAVIVRNTRRIRLLFSSAYPYQQLFATILYDLSIDDIRAALKFAGKLIEQEQYHPLPGSK